MIAIVTYFNYSRNPFMRGNLERAIRRLEDQGAEVLLMEAALRNREFVLDADISLRSKDMIWQKERMTNIAIEGLSDRHEHFAWIDNDILMPDGWIEDAEEKLKTHPMVQLYEYLDYRNRDGSVEHSLPSFAYLASKRNFGLELDQAKCGGPGAAWAGRTDLFRGMGMYDRHITCGSDTMMGISLMRCRLAVLLQRRQHPGWGSMLFNEAISSHHREWDVEFTSRLEEMTGSDNPEDWYTHLPIRIDHLFHGKYKSRNYMGRHNLLRKYDFDPKNDLKLNEDGLLEWGSDKPEFHEAIRRVFADMRGPIPVS